MRPTDQTASDSALTRGEGAGGVRGACRHCWHRERMVQNLFCAECSRHYAGALTADECAAIVRSPLYFAHNSAMPMSIQAVPHA